MIYTWPFWASGYKQNVNKIYVFIRQVICYFLAFIAICNVIGTRYIVSLRFERDMVDNL